MEYSPQTHSWVCTGRLRPAKLFSRSQADGCPRPALEGLIKKAEPRDTTLRI